MNGSHIKRVSHEFGTIGLVKALVRDRSRHKQKYLVTTLAGILCYNISKIISSKHKLDYEVTVTVWIYSNMSTVSVDQPFLPLIR